MRDAVFLFGLATTFVVQFIQEGKRRNRTAPFACHRQ
jgi:hypothetical protein